MEKKLTSYLKTKHWLLGIHDPEYELPVQTNWKEYIQASLHLVQLQEPVSSLSNQSIKGTI